MIGAARIRLRIAQLPNPPQDQREQYDDGQADELDALRDVVPDILQARFDALKHVPNPAQVTPSFDLFHRDSISLVHHCPPMFIPLLFCSPMLRLTKARVNSPERVPV